MVAAERAVERPRATPRTTDFEYTKDWTVNAGGRGAPPLEALDVTGNLVFAGNGYVINKTKINPYEGLDVKGKIIVVAGLPAELAAQQAAGGGRGRGGRAGADAAAPAAVQMRPPRRKRSRRSASESPGRGVHRFSDAGTIRGEKWRSGSRHDRQFPAAHGHGQPQRRRRFRRLWRWRWRARGTQRAELPGPQTPGDAGVRQRPIDHRRPVDDQQHFPGRETERAADILRRRIQCQTGFLRTVRGEEDQPESGAQERDQSRAKTSSASSKAATRTEERIRRDQRAPGSHRAGRAAARRAQRQQRRGRRRLRFRRPAGPRAVLCGRRRQGDTAQAQHRLRVAGRRRERACGARNTSPNFPSSTSRRSWPT